MCVSFQFIWKQKVLEVFYVKTTQKELTNAQLLLVTNPLCE
jgi:hypothetical protein